ncbi:S-layer homology domain-containing protein [Paenibacillus yanchengensis]|uniref:S-layer homology domain-containing protein n=1 Tax=Paenibacillus yanchengensis TaxID=2035833 RepID=A0ABW4YJS5_9BACL
MKLHRHMKKTIVSVAAATLLMGGIPTLAPLSSSAVHAEVVNQAATIFKDVKAGLWAEKHIAKLSLQRIINGYYDEKTATYSFKPNQSVSQEEAVVMALRFAGLEKDLDSSTDITFDESFQVTKYAKPYIQLAFDKQFLDKEQEYSLAGEDKANNWGTKPATREWVTKLIVRAIGEEEAAKRLQNSESSFRDADAIDSKYVGYVNAATQMDLIKGITNSKGTSFEPKDPINRASLATLLSRAQHQIEVNYEGQSTGIVSKLTDKEVALYVDGKETTYQLNDQTAYYHFQTENSMRKQELIEYGDALVIAENGVAKYVEVMGVEKKVESVVGTVVLYNNEEKMLYLLVNGKPEGFLTNDQVIIESADGKVLQLADLKRDREVTVLRDKFRSTPQTIKIVVSSAPIVSTVSGKLMSKSNKLVTISQTTTTNTTGKLDTYYLAPHVAVEINGMLDASIEQLVVEGDADGNAAGDVVQLSINEDGQVTKIKVENRSVEVLAGVKAFFNKDLPNYIILTDAFDKNAKTLAFTADTRFDMNGTKLDKANALQMLNTNVNVKVSYTSDKIISMSFVTEYTGTVVERNTVDKTLTFKLAEGATVKLPYASYGNMAMPIEKRGISNATIADLRQGDTISVGMNMGQLQIMNVRVQATEQMQITNIDLANNKVTFRTNQNTTFTQSINKAELLGSTGLKLALNRFKVGETVNTTFIGNEMLKMQSIDSGN